MHSYSIIGEVMMKVPFLLLVLALSFYRCGAEGNTSIKTCKKGERLLEFTLTTDLYAYETTFEWLTVNGVFASGPGENRNFADNTTYRYKYCVKIGQQYRLRLKDSANDGLCCQYGEGTYKAAIDGETIFDSNKKRTFTSVATKTFRVKARPVTSTNDNDSNSNGAITGKNDSGGSSSATGCITVKVKADKNPEELSWSIVNRNGNQVASSSTLKALASVSKKVCLPKGQYEFQMKDKYGDGFGTVGSYHVYLDGGEEIFRGKHFQYVKKYKIQINPPYEANMSHRDREWLTAHNQRRRKYHNEYGASYVPLKWSPALAKQAKTWAAKLLEECEMKGLKHEKGVAEGENLAKNRGSGTYGKQYPADNILTRWVEKELDVGYPANAHLTQCLWRATKYVGCGEDSRPMKGGKGTCRVQVCRYSRAGNCNMNQYSATLGNNWIKPMMEDHSRCGPDCAPEGCY